MDVFLKVMAAILVTAILTLILAKHSADISLLLTISVCCMVIAVAVSYLQPILDFAYRLIQIGDLDTSLLSVVLKSVGIGIVSQVAGLICADSGNQSLGKAVQIMATAIILGFSVPAFEQMLLLVEMVLEKV